MGFLLKQEGQLWCYGERLRPKVNSICWGVQTAIERTKRIVLWNDISTWRQDEVEVVIFESVLHMIWKIKYFESFRF